MSNNWKSWAPGAVAVFALLLGNLFHWTPDQVKTFKDWVIDLIPIILAGIAFFHGILKDHGKKGTGK